MLYILGDPGIGKSTLAAALMKGWSYDEVMDPFAHRVYENGVVALGKGGGDFPGTDTLAMDVQPKVLEWVKRLEPPMLLGEGDRLANAKFFNGLLRLGYALWPVYLAGRSLAAERRRERSQRTGKTQNPHWVKGRVTKNARMALNYDAFEMHPTLPADTLVRLLPGPVAEACRRG